MNTNNALTVIEPAGVLARSPSLPSLDRLRENMQRHKDERALMIQFVKSNMIPGKHHYTLQEGKKPSLSQDGARLVCSLYELRQGEPELIEAYEEGHYTCRATVVLLSLSNGMEVARGTGSCSTRESKYAWRWVWKNELPRGADVAALQTKSTRKGGMLYRVLNPDIADAYNTVLKMAVKRAHVAATLQLPCIADQFEDAIDEVEEDPEEKAMLRRLRVAFGDIPKQLREKASQALLGCAMAELPQKPLEDLQGCLAFLQSINVKMWNWGSGDLKKLIALQLQKSAKDSSADIFGDRQEGQTQQQQTEAAITFLQEHELPGLLADDDLMEKEEREALQAEREGV